LLLLVGLPFAWWLRRSQVRAFDAGSVQQAQRGMQQLALLDQRHQFRIGELERIEIELRAQLGNSNLLLREQRAALSASEHREADLRAGSKEAERAMAGREELLTRNGEALKAQFAQLAGAALEAQGNSIARLGQRSVDQVLSPFREQMLELKRRADEIHYVETKERASLLSEVRALQKASDRINTEAANLTRALKGDQRLQGSWGEMVLERLLQQSGLEPGREYSAQKSLRNAEGAQKRPDVVVHLPDRKDVVIDSKVSLVAFERAVKAADTTERDSALEAHVQSLRSHVKSLSSQSYEQLQDLRSLDFVLMFVPIEAALTQALEQDAHLLEDAMRQRILLVSPTTLLLSLRVVHNLWRHDKQNRNAQEIADRAGAIYDKVRLLAEDLEAIGRQLGVLDGLYLSARSRTLEGRGNLVRQVAQMQKLGARIKTPLADAVVEKSMVD
jgi:DNA recombination protein RmuC